MILGITGGIGCGKSAVLSILKEQYQFHVFEADAIAHELMRPGESIYQAVVSEFGTEILQENGEIDRQKFGALVFRDQEKLERLDALTHPAVIAEIKQRIETIRAEEPDGRFVIEAALLIESGCYKICDKVWYIYADVETRTRRLMEFRNYTEDKIKHVMQNQLSHEEFKKYTDEMIDNSGTIEETSIQIQKKLVL
jgi:dephospho-CoA kinase